MRHTSLPPSFFPSITACLWIQVCIGHSGVYRGHHGDVKGRLFVSYKSYLVLLKYMIG